MEPAIGLYLDWLAKERGRSPRTVDTYAHTLHRLAERMNGKGVLAAELADLRGFVLAPVARATRHSEVGDEPAPATRKRRVAELRSFYGWLCAEGLRADNPAARLVAPTVHNEHPHPVPHDTWVRFWSSPRLGDAERVAFGLGYFCGLRRHEIVSLAPTHFEGGRIVGFQRKGGSTASLPWGSCVALLGQRAPSLVGGDPETFAGPLRRLLRARGGQRWLLPWPEHQGAIMPHMVNKRLRVALRSQRSDELAFSPHMLRHSFCTNLLIECDVPLLAVSRLANHSSVVVTQRYLATSEDPLAALIAEWAE